MPPKFAANDADTIPVHIIESSNLQAFLEQAKPTVRTWLKATGFQGHLGQVQLIPDAAGNLSAVAMGYGGADKRARGRFHLARGAAALPAGAYHLETTLQGDALSNEVLGWLLSAYKFDRYKNKSDKQVLLKAPDGVDAARLEQIAEAEFLTRDLINTPAADMGPVALAEAARALAARFGSEIDICVGEDLLTRNFPIIHAVGRAAVEAPRLIDFRWGQAGPRLTLVGKGVCFDTGGLNLKPGASMGLMKKDMGGAATVLGLAQMIMALDLPLQLRVLIPAVENSVSAPSFRPQDVLTSRKGLTVEVNNTDAEGRLVLADALALADEEPTDLILSMATLTGAARVAVGPDIAPFYANQDGFAEALSAAAQRVADPVWRLPFHAPYEAKIEPDIADLDNAPSGGFAGSITAALFLRRFVDAEAYAHFDIYGWQPSAAPARPKGGVGQGARAVFEALPHVLGF